MRLKGTMIYLTDHEKKIFTDFAESHKKSISTTIRDSALSYIANTKVIMPQIENNEIALLKQRIAFLEDKLEQPQLKGNIPRMVAKIYQAIKDDWINVDQLRELFDIDSEEDADDFNIAMHEFQQIHLNPQTFENDEIVNLESEFEFNSFKNAYRRRRT